MVEELGELTMSGPDGPTISSAEQMGGLFFGEILQLVPVWRQRLIDNPDDLEALEREVHAEFVRGADMIVAGLLSIIFKMPELAAASEGTRKQFQHPVTRGRFRRVKIKLLGGFVMWIGTLYCEPKKRLFRKPNDQAVGVFPYLAQFGFGKGVTPGLESLVARQAALCPSLELARAEFERSGLKLDIKSVRRIANQCGEGLLNLRKTQLMQWRDGKLPAGDDFNDQCVTVQIDGGRAKIRSKLTESKSQPESRNAEGFVDQDAPGRSKPKSKRSFQADWREPKLVTIFVHDEQGRMVKESQATIDGTLTGPDAIAELVAMHLHRLGAAKAKSVTFVADGATWIWDRIDRIVSKAQIPATVKIHQILDNCHASHHISRALASLGFNDQERMAHYRVYRTTMRNGKWRQVVEDLSGVAEEQPDNKEVKTEIEYLKKHGEAGRLSYPHFRTLGLPLGSGAIESSIRRVINLRLKSNGTFWLESNAEIMLQLRALVVSGRWDERLAQMRAMYRRQNEADWTWTPQPMSCKSEAESSTP